MHQSPTATVSVLIFWASYKAWSARSPDLNAKNAAAWLAAQAFLDFDWAAITKFSFDCPNAWSWANIHEIKEYLVTNVLRLATEKGLILIQHVTVLLASSTNGNRCHSNSECAALQAVVRSVSRVLGRVEQMPAGHQGLGEQGYQEVENVE